MYENRMPRIFANLGNIVFLSSIIIGIITKSFVVGALCFGGSLLSLLLPACVNLKSHVAGMVSFIISLSLINWAASKVMFDGAILWVALFHFLAVIALTTGLRFKAQLVGKKVNAGALILISVCIGLYAFFAPVVLSHHAVHPYADILNAMKVLFFTAGSSFWGIFYFIVLSIVGYLAARKFGTFFFPLIIFSYIAYISASYPDIAGSVYRMVRLGPIPFSQELFNFFSDSSGSAANGLILMGLIWSWFLVPAYVHQLALQRISETFMDMKRLIGTKIAKELVDYQMQKEETLSLMLAMGLVIGGWAFVVIVLWKMFFNVSSAIPLNFYWFQVPDIRVPHWKPVWHYSYFLIAAVYFLLFQVFQHIQMAIQNAHVPKNRIMIQAIWAIVFALFFPAGVVLFFIGHLLGKIIILPFLQSSMVLDTDSSDEAHQKRNQAPPKPTVAPKPPVKSEHIQIKTSIPSVTQPSTSRLLFNHRKEIVDVESIGLNVHFVLDSGGMLSRYGDNGMQSTEVPDLDSPYALWLRDEKIILGDKTGKILVGHADLPDGQIFTTLYTEKPFESLSVNGFGTISAFTSLDKKEIFIRLHGPGKIMPLFNLGNQRATILSFSMDNQFLGIGTEDGDILLYDMASREVKRTYDYLTLPSGENKWPQVSHISFIDGGSLIAAYENGRLACWQDIKSYCGGDCRVKGRITTLSHDSNSDRVVIGMYDGTVQLFALSKLNTVLFSQKLHDAEVVKATLVDGQLLSVSRDGKAILTKL